MSRPSDENASPALPLRHRDQTRTENFEGVFDEDYLYFYETFLTPERNTAQADLVCRLLNLRPGDELLDVPCGHGRIANLVAAQGVRVTGLDANRLFLDRARAEAAAATAGGADAQAGAAGTPPEYSEGDMRRLPWDGPRFDALLNWFTSFGYFDDDTNRAVLREFRRVLRPGGRLLLETVNRDRVVNGLTAGAGSNTEVVRRGDDFMIDRVRFDARTGRTETERTIVRGGRVREARFSVRLFTAPELADWLVAAGFTDVEALGADGEPFSVDSRRLILLARAPA